MLRIDKIESLLYKYSSEKNIENILNDVSIGMSSLDISNKLNILRNNASCDLNKLFKNGRLIKIKGKPTRYFHIDVFENKFNLQLEYFPVECTSLQNLTIKNNISCKVSQTKYHTNKMNKNFDPFNKLIGSQYSLSKIINISKSAILYPNGLHTLLLGESGVGKSLFAELMYEYGVLNKIFHKNSSFVVFNCADYANNSNLLLAQLFGTTKGAYTGAESYKEGLIEKANGGVLFLDEIHRLPPEGQEMLFLFMDKNKFRRLGETSIERTSKVFIIAATTEIPSSTLLTTFIRRIPNILKIPSFNERSLNERLAIINSLFIAEAQNIKRSIIVDKQCLHKLLTYNPPGNIGQLSSDIKISVARSFFDSQSTNSNYINLSVEDLPIYGILNSLSLSEKTRKTLNLILTQNSYIYNSNSTFHEIENITSNDNIKNYINTLSNTEDTYNIEEIFKTYNDMIETSFCHNSFYPDFITNEINEIVTTFSEILYKKLNLILDKSSYVALALYFKNLNDGNIPHTNTQDLVSFTSIPSNILSVSEEIISLLEKKFGIYYSNENIKTLAIILNSLKNKEISDTVGIIIATHGISIASNIAKIANEILGINFIFPIDMPFSDSPSELLKLLIKKIESNNFSNGILIFADMGSLTTFDEIIKEKTNKEVFTIQSTNILLILEAAQKSIFLKSDLNTILYDLQLLNSKLTFDIDKKIKKYLSIKKTKVIYTTCNSGEGSAFYLKHTLDILLTENNIFNIEIIPLKIENKAQTRDIIYKTSIDKDIITIVGSVNPYFDNIPFISLDSILLYKGFDELLSLIDNKLVNIKNIESLTKELTISISCDAINNYLSILSAEKIKDYILNFISIIENNLNIKFSNSTLTKLFIHTSCMLERYLLNEFTLSSNENITNYKVKNSYLFSTIKKAFDYLKKFFHICITEDEIYYIAEIIKSYLEEYHE